MANFCEMQEVADVLQVAITDADQAASCERAIVEATAAIRNYCHQTIELVADDEYTFDVWSPCWKLFLPELPVISVASVVEDEETLTVTDDYKLANHGQLVRVDQRWPVGVQIVTVTYTHGYATIPDDVVAVCARAAARRFQAGLKAADSDGVPGITAKALGDFSVSFTSEAGGGMGEGLMGVSGARMLLLSEKDILDRYRYVGP